MNDQMIPFAKDEDGDCCYLGWKGHFELITMVMLVIAIVAFVLAPLYMPELVNWRQVICVTVVGIVLVALKDPTSLALKKFWGSV